MGDRFSKSSIALPVIFISSVFSMWDFQRTKTWTARLGKSITPVRCHRNFPMTCVHFKGPQRDNTHQYAPNRYLVLHFHVCNRGCRQLVGTIVKDFDWQCALVYVTQCANGDVSAGKIHPAARAHDNSFPAEVHGEMGSFSTIAMWLGTKTNVVWIVRNVLNFLLNALPPNFQLAVFMLKRLHGAIPNQMGNKHFRPGVWLSAICNVLFIQLNSCVVWNFELASFKIHTPEKRMRGFV